MHSGDFELILAHGKLYNRNTVISADALCDPACDLVALENVGPAPEQRLANPRLKPSEANGSGVSWDLSLTYWRRAVLIPGDRNGRPGSSPEILN
jgi:hypothetical protein